MQYENNSVEGMTSCVIQVCLGDCTRNGDVIEVDYCNNAKEEEGRPIDSVVKMLIDCYEMVLILWSVGLIKPRLPFTRTNSTHRHTPLWMRTRTRKSFKKW